MTPLACIACQLPLSSPARLTGQDRLHGLSNDIYEVAVCQHCGAGTTLPILSEEDVSAFYPSNYSAYQAPKASPLSYALNVFMRMRHKRTLAAQPFTSLGPPGRALDIGCGRGDLAAALIKDGWQVDGVEPSPDACAIARSRGVDALEGTLSTVNLKNESYSAVIFSHCLEHVADPRQTLQQAADLLAPGGLAIISVPNFESWQRHRFGSAWFGLDLPRHRAHFTAKALRQLASDAGLEVLQTTTSTSAVSLPASLQYRIFGRCVFRDGLRFYFANTIAISLLPISALIDRTLGQADSLHVVARRPTLTSYGHVAH